MVHGLLGEKTIPRNLLFLQDWAAVAKAKARRVMLWFADPGTVYTVMAYIIASGPAEHLLQTLQSLDHRGGILRDICNVATCPFRECRTTYMGMLVAPMATAARMLVHHFEHMGLSVLQQIMFLMFACILVLSAKIWLDLELKYCGFPFKMLRCAIPSSSNCAEDAARELYDANECCLDESMSKKARRLAKDAASFMKHVGLLTALWIWSWTGRITDMGTERLFAKYS